MSNVFLWRVVTNKLLSLGPSRHMSFGLSSEGLPEPKLGVQPLTQDPFSYTTETASRYTLAQFQGIMVDTRASKRSTGGYGQFLALQRQDSAIQLNIATQGIVNV